MHRESKKENFSGYPDAKDLLVGVIQGNSYNPEFWHSKLNTQSYVDLITNLKLLAGKRIDLFPADKTIGLYNTKQMHLQDQIDYYDFVLFSKGYPMPFTKTSDYPNIEKNSA